MRSPARLVTGTAAAALTAVALGLATAPSAYAEGVVARPESPAWPAAPDGSGDGDRGLPGAETDPKAQTVPGTDTDPGTETDLTETDLTETDLTETELTETELTETELGTVVRPGTSPRPEPVKPPPGTKPSPVKPPVSPPGTWPERPSGHVRTGVGGSAGPDTVQLAVGAGVLGSAAVGGVWLLRRLPHGRRAGRLTATPRGRRRGQDDPEVQGMAGGHRRTVRHLARPERRGHPDRRAPAVHGRSLRRGSRTPAGIGGRRTAAPLRTGPHPHPRHRCGRTHDAPGPRPGRQPRRTASTGNRNIAGWFKGGAPPGAKGTAIVAGHVDNAQGPSVFYALGSLKKGTVVEIDRKDGRTAVFSVDAIEVYDNEDFPDQRVYGASPHASLRLITCGGGFSQQTGYLGNVVAYAHLTEVR